MLARRVPSRRQHAPRILIVAIFAATLVFGRAAAGQAEPSPLAIRWSVPAGCPDVRGVRANVLALAGVGEAFEHHLDAHATIREELGTWYLELTTEFDGMTGERKLSSSSCKALVDAATLTLALILNPEMTRTAEPRPEREQPAPPRGNRDVDKHDAQLLLRGRLALHAGVQVGTMKHPAPELGLGAGLSLGPMTGWIVASYGPPQDAHANGSSGPGGRLWSGSAAAQACWNFLGGSAELGPCLGAEIDRLEGQGIGVDEPRHAVTTWGSGVVGATAAAHIGRIFFVYFGGFALVPVTRPTFFLEDIGTVQRPAAFGARLRAGAGFELP